MNINRIPVMNMSQIMQKIPQIKINQTITKSLAMKESLRMKKMRLCMVKHMIIYHGFILIIKWKQTHPLTQIKRLTKGMK